MRDIISGIIKTSIEVSEAHIKAIRECAWRDGEETLEDILKIAELDGERKAYQTIDNLLSGREPDDDGGGSMTQTNTEATEERLRYIRSYYNVSAFIGGTVRCLGAYDGVIVGAYGSYLLIDLGEGEALPYHPTWEIEYLTGGGK